MEALSLALSCVNDVSRAGTCLGPKTQYKANGTTLEPLDLNVTLKLDSSAIY